MEKIIWGCDGVARGNFAGINIWAIAGIPEGVILPVRDSKLTKKKQRQEILENIKDKCYFAIGSASVAEIEQHGIDMAEQRSLRRALYLAIKLGYDVDHLYGDMLMPFIPKLAMTRSKDADAHIPCVSAASIFAKYALDLYWERVHQYFPEYDFTNNSGYGIKAKQAIAAHGLIEGVHRRNYAPCREYLKNYVQNQ